jgi:hypothetical protein
VRAAKITESIASRAAVRDDLQKLLREENLDRAGLMSALHDRLLALQVPNAVALTFMQIDDPVAGDDAYRWLLGYPVPHGSPLGDVQPLGRTDSAASGYADRDLASIDALEIVAALHSIAGVPLVVLIDQLEVMFRTPDRMRVETLSSLLKKLIEQLGRQQALLFIAGTDDVWEKVPRDVPPRLRRREPLLVGGLTALETGLLLDAYLQTPSNRALAPHVVSHVAERIHELSGGTPREIVRIAHHVWQKTGGALLRATDKDLLESASESGTIADREHLALSLADQVLAEFGAVSAEVSVGPDLQIDRVLRDNRGTVLAGLMVLRATDQVSEVDAARRVRALVQYCAEQWKGAIAGAVAVGYSSGEIRGLLENITKIFLFDDRTFSADLRSWLAEGIQRDARQEPSSDPAISSALHDLATRLRELETRRFADVEAVQTRFEQRTTEVAAPARQRAELRTRREMLEAIDELFETMAQGHAEEERKTMHALLVANEARMKSERVEGLGGVFLDALGLERLNWDVGSPARLEESRGLRADILGEIRRALRERSGPALFPAETGKIALIVGLIAAATVAVLWIVGLQYPLRTFEYSAQSSAIFPRLVGVVALIVSMASISIFAMTVSRRAGSDRLINRFRRQVAQVWGRPSYDQLVSEQTREKYPQAR